MQVNSIKLNNFRNISSIELEACDGVNVIYGENAQGKTNILEAMWLFTGCKSFRGAKDAELIKFEEEFAKISLDFSDNVREKNSQIIIGNKKKSVLHNGVSLNSSAELIGSFYSVIFSPSHLSLIKDGPSQRRKFIDTALCQLKPSYAQKLALYKKALLQRNALLKDINLNAELYDMLDMWDDQLAKYSATVIFERLKYIDILSEYSKQIYSGISENKEEFSVTYSRETDSNITIEDLYIKKEKELVNVFKENFSSFSIFENSEELIGSDNIVDNTFYISFSTKKRNVIPLLGNERIDEINSTAKDIYKDLDNYCDYKFAYIEGINKI